MPTSKPLFILAIVTVFCLSGCSSDPIAAVKGGTMEFDKSRTVGAALAANPRLKNPAWATEDGGGRTLVVFTADLDDPQAQLASSLLVKADGDGAFNEEREKRLKVDADSVSVRIKFAVSQSDETFEPIASAHVLKCSIKEGNAVVKTRELEFTAKDPASFLKMNYPE